LASGVVLDASAILAVLFNEPGSDAVAPLIDRAAVSAVNLAEAHAQLLHRGVKAEDAWRGLRELGCEVCPFDEPMARLAGELAHPLRDPPLSFGGRACLALALSRRAVVYTTEASWERLGVGVEVKVIR